LVEVRNESGVEDVDSAGVTLLADVRAVFDDGEVLGVISTKTLIEALKEDAEAPWSEWRGAGLTPHSLSKLLKPYGIRSRTVRMDDATTPKGFKRTQFEDAWTRYLPGNGAEKRHTATSQDSSGFAGESDPPHAQVCGGSESGAIPPQQTVVAVVADRNPESGEMAVLEAPDDARAAAVGRTLAQADLLPPGEREFVLELVETLDAVLVDDVDAR